MYSTYQHVIVQANFRQRCSADSRRIANFSTETRGCLQKIVPRDPTLVGCTHVVQIQMQVREASLPQDPPLPDVRAVHVPVEPLRRSERPDLLPLIAGTRT